jgi:asparagine synthase (glutamine-hydrolysing)
MCGICGFIDPSGGDPTVVGRMARRAAHRGPDGEGYWLWDGAAATGAFVDEPAALGGRAPARVALGHTRLAIIDLTRAGQQPMRCEDGTCWIALNGEIYNYLELREELTRLGHRFRTRTDTEVALAAWREWGAGCFPRFNGMWGLAIVDLRARTLTLARDRLGVKPLYLWRGGGALFFCSEIKQLLDAPGFRPRANADAVAEFVDTGYESPPQTFFEGVTAFPSGHYAVVDLDAPAAPAPRSFWEPEAIAVTPMEPEEATQTFRALFADAVRLRLRADVPVGTCLSGGIDSSAIFLQVALLRNGAAPRHAFSALFDDERFDERRYVAEILCRYHGVSHSVFPTPGGFLADQDAFVYQHDEPPGSLSVYAAACVMRLAREHAVRVLLNGQGGDELFGGYWPAYFLWLRSTLASSPLDFAWNVAGALLPGGNRELFRQLLPHWRQYRARQMRDNRGLLRPPYRDAGFTLNRNWAQEAQELSPAAYRMREIRRVHLPRLLKWEDRNSMAYAVEGRYPFLDYRLVEWAGAVPPELNFRRGWNKWIVREGIGDQFPEAIRFRRDKIGFETPQAAWIAAELRPVLERWAREPSARFAEIVDLTALRDLVPAVVREEQHRMDERQFLLLRLYFLDQWLRRFEVQ